jgi:hypothetical protein
MTERDFNVAATLRFTTADPETFGYGFVPHINPRRRAVE